MSILKRLFGKSTLEFVTMPAYIQAESWDKLRRIVEEHPELLSDEADALITRVIQGAAHHGDAPAKRFLEERRALLRRCRQVGTAQAFAEQAPPGFTETLSQMQPMLDALNKLPEEQARPLADIFAHARSPQEVEAALQARPDLADALAQAMQGVRPVEQDENPS